MQQPQKCNTRIKSTHAKRPRNAHVSPASDNILFLNSQEPHLPPHAPLPIQIISENLNDTLNNDCPNAPKEDKYTDQWLHQFAPPIIHRIKKMAKGAELEDEDIVEEERMEDGEVDDSPEEKRIVKMIAVLNKPGTAELLTPKAKERRRWIVLPLRSSDIL